MHRRRKIIPLNLAVKPKCRSPWGQTVSNKERQRIGIKCDSCRSQPELSPDIVCTKRRARDRRHQRSGLAPASMRPAPKRGFWLVAKREWRWLLHDRLAPILIFGVPLFAFAVLT